MAELNRLNGRTKKSTIGLRGLLESRLASMAPLLTLLVLIILFSITSQKFLTPENLFNITGQIAILAMVASGMTLVVLLGEIDLSVANIATMTGIIIAMLFTSKSGLFAGHALPSILAGILAAAFIGLVAGLCVSRLGIPSFAVTLATMQISRGITMTVTEGEPIYTIPESLKWLGTFRIGPVPGIALIAVGVVLIFYLLLKFTHFGRYVYAVGGNRTAAKTVGIRNSLIITSVMAIAGMMAGIGGMFTIGRLGSAQTFGSEDLLIDSLAAVVIGGTALSGGVGGIANTVLGVLILGVLNNGLNQMSSNIFLKYLLKGLILLAALIINILTVWIKTNSSRSQLSRIAEEPTIETPVAK